MNDWPQILAYLATSVLGGVFGGGVMWLAVRHTRRPHTPRPPQRTGNAGRGPARNHHMPAHPKPPLAVDPGRTALVVPVITREIAPSPYVRWRQP